MQTCPNCGTLFVSSVRFCSSCGSRRPEITPADRGEVDFSKSEATRLLSAACYLNPTFRVSIYESFVRNRYRALAPDYGIDLATLVRHCLHSRKRAFVRSLAFYFATVVISLANSFLFQGSFATYLYVLVVAIIGISFLYRWSTFLLICKHFTRAPLDSSFVPELPAKLEYLAKPQGNLVVYSGFSPFVGSGIRQSAWSFATDIRRGKLRLDGGTEKPRPFTTAELYSAISAALHHLSLDGLSVEDRLYVNGQDVREDPRLFDETTLRPRTSIDGGLMESYIAPASPGPVRHYRCVRVVKWDGELVVALYFRLAQTATNLFVEASSHLLTPVDDLYRQVEKIHKNPTVLQLLIHSFVSILVAIPYALWSSLHVLARIIRPISDFFTHLFEDWFTSQKPVYDFGATGSARELASSFFSYRRYSIRQDGEMASKIVEETVLDSIIDFLDAHAIDTAGIRDRQTTILNNGVHISGGTIQANSVAIGKGAKAGRMMGKFIPKNRAKSAAAGA